MRRTATQRPPLTSFTAAAAARVALSQAQQETLAARLTLSLQPLAFQHRPPRPRVTRPARLSAFSGDRAGNAQRGDSVSLGRELGRCVCGLPVLSDSLAVGKCSSSICHSNRRRCTHTDTAHHSIMLGGEHRQHRQLCSCRLSLSCSALPVVLGPPEVWQPNSNCLRTMLMAAETSLFQGRECLCSCCAGCAQRAE